MKIIIESNNGNDNWGDASMLHSSIRRLIEKYTAPSLSLLDGGSDSVAQAYQNVQVFPSHLRQSWRLQRPLWYRLDRGMPSAVDHFSTACPRTKDWITAVKTSILGGNIDAREEFVSRLSSADVLVISGGGFVTDLFHAAERVLNLIMLADSRNIPVFMFGQGIGPIRTSRLWGKAERALPRVRSISLREKKFSYPILRELGVSDDRITVTGDDAVSLAYDQRPQSLGDGIGVNVRIAYYSEVSEGLKDKVSRVFSEVASSYSAPLVPIPISHEGNDSDIDHIRSIIEAAGDESDGGDSLSKPEEVMRQAGKCRVVVTGSYHGGVFALSQGVPVVALANSEYYHNKFHGLADMFGSGCTVLRTDLEDFEEKLTDAIRKAWRQAPDLRPRLLESAERQIDATESAYDEMVEFLNIKSYS